MRKQIHKSIDWLFDKAQYISGIAFIILTIVDISNINEWTIKAFGIKNFQIGKIIYYFAVIIAMIFGVFAVKNAEETGKLEKDNREKADKIRNLEEAINNIEKDTDELFNFYLKLLIQNLDFTHEERLSVYKVVENRFVLIGRTSVNPNLAKKGRNSYPINEGFIGKGWEEGSFFIDNLPSVITKDGNAYYNKVNSIKEIPREVIDRINMKSRTYYVHRIDSFDGDPRAVLVFESLKEKAFKEDNIKNLINEVKQPLTMFIEKNIKFKYSQNGLEL